ncbi:MAG: hypothetical protein Q4C00_02640, partial [Bacillota bacterium]|nr:hypothetical protein [Bacillota bacterium]
SRSQLEAEEIPFVKQIPFYYLTDLQPKQGNLANFYIRVYSRRNSSMQGFITWHKTQVTMGFRSEMELILLIRNVLLSKKQEGMMLIE